MAWRIVAAAGDIAAGAAAAAAVVQTAVNCRRFENECVCPNMNVGEDQGHFVLLVHHIVDRDDQRRHNDNSRDNEGHHD